MVSWPIGAQSQGCQPIGAQSQVMGTCVNQSQARSPLTTAREHTRCVDDKIENDKNTFLNNNNLMSLKRWIIHQSFDVINLSPFNQLKVSIFLLLQAQDQSPKYSRRSPKPPSSLEIPAYFETFPADIQQYRHVPPPAPQQQPRWGVCQLMNGDKTFAFSRFPHGLTVSNVALPLPRDVPFPRQRSSATPVTSPVPEFVGKRWLSSRQLWWEYLQESPTLATECLILVVFTAHLPQ